MFVVYIGMTGIEEVLLASEIADTDAEAVKRLELAFWPVIKPHLQRINKDLRAIAERVQEKTA